MKNEGLLRPSCSSSCNFWKFNPLPFMKASVIQYPNSVDRIPKPAPTMTSLSQCLLFAIRISPVAVAMVYAPTLTHGEMCPYSLDSIVAVIKAVAVCPEGKLCLLLPSGRVTLVVYLSPCTTPVIKVMVIASLIIILPHEDLLGTPAAFKPSMTAAGAICV